MHSFQKLQLEATAPAAPSSKRIMVRQNVWWPGLETRLSDRGRGDAGHSIVGALVQRAAAAEGLAGQPADDRPAAHRALQSCKVEGEQRELMVPDVFLPAEFPCMAGDDTIARRRRRTCTCRRTRWQRWPTWRRTAPASAVTRRSASCRSSNSSCAGCSGWSTCRTAHRETRRRWRTVS